MERGEVTEFSRKLLRMPHGICVLTMKRRKSRNKCTDTSIPYNNRDACRWYGRTATNLMWSLNITRRVLDEAGERVERSLKTVAGRLPTHLWLTRSTIAASLAYTVLFKEGGCYAHTVPLIMSPHFCDDTSTVSLGPLLTTRV